MTIKKAEARGLGNAQFLLIELEDGTGAAFTLDHNKHNKARFDNFIHELESKNPGYFWQWDESSLAGLKV